MSQKFLGSEFQVQINFNGGGINVTVNGKHFPDQETPEETQFRMHLLTALAAMSRKEDKEIEQLTNSLVHFTTTYATDRAVAHKKAIQLQAQGWKVDPNHANIIENKNGDVEDITEYIQPESLIKEENPFKELFTDEAWEEKTKYENRRAKEVIRRSGHTYLNLDPKTNKSNEPALIFAEIVARLEETGLDTKEAEKAAVCKYIPIEYTVRLEEKKTLHIGKLESISADELGGIAIDNSLVQYDIVVTVDDNGKIDWEHIDYEPKTN